MLFNRIFAALILAAFSFAYTYGQAQQGAVSGPEIVVPHPQIDEDFRYLQLPAGVWRIAGPWKGTGGNLLDPQNAKISSTYKGANGGFLLLTSKANTLRGAEVQTLSTHRYGYYETRLRTTDVPGVCVSFFWIQAPSYGPLEIDIEFLTNEPWIKSEDTGKVHLFIHPAEQTAIAELSFNPAREFHTYGFLWTPGTVAFTVDKKVVQTFSDKTLQTEASGFLMMNSWTGSKNWGGGPPARDATSAYDWVRFYPGAVSVVP